MKLEFFGPVCACVRDSERNILLNNCLFAAAVSVKAVTVSGQTEDSISLMWELYLKI